MNARLLQAEPSAQRVPACLVLLGLVCSAPFSFYPKSEAIGALGFLITSVGIASSSSLSRFHLGVATMHCAALLAACALFLHHSFDFLYVKFMLALVLSFQLTLADPDLLATLRNWIIYLGARGAVLAIVSFIAYFAFGMAPFYRTLLGDGRLIPFFGLTNINFGFETSELLIFARPAFLFDEPGQFAHFAVLLLALIGLSAASLREKWRAESWLLFFSGMATFSLAFLITASMYACSRLLRWRTWLFIALLTVLGMALSDNPLVETLLSRVAFTEQPGGEQVLQGDNRSREVKLAYDAFVSNPVWGAGWTRTEQTVDHFGANLLGPFGYSGLLALPLYLPLLIRLFRCARATVNINQLLIVVLVGAFFAQRPYFYFPIFILLMEIMVRQLTEHNGPEQISEKYQGYVLRQSRL